MATYLAIASFTDQFWRVLLLQDYNTRIVFLGTTMLGAAAGLVGSFMLLRKRSLLGDAVSHATLPGIALAFITVQLLGGDGKSLPVLLTGAMITGVMGMLCVTAIRRYSRLKDDAALAIVLSVFFGLGIVLFTVVQKMPGGNAAGLHHFIMGKTASMVLRDAVVIAVASTVIAAICLLLFKEFTLLCFDQGYAASQGWPAGFLDLLMMTLVAAVTVIGLESVGLLLVIALLIVPPSAARFWTDHMPRMTLAAACIGAASAYVGAFASAMAPKLAAGAVITLAGAAAFLVSMLFGARRGLVGRWLRQRRLVRRVGRQHLLRAFYETIEQRQQVAGHRATATRDHGLRSHVAFDELLASRTWTRPQLKRWLRQALDAELIESMGEGAYRLRDAGIKLAQQAVRNHRLWEAYLIHFADIAASHVDRDADEIEHVLAPDMVRNLEELLGVSRAAKDDAGAANVPPSPHAITA